MNTTMKLKLLACLAVIVALSYEPHIGCGHSGCCIVPDSTSKPNSPLRVAPSSDDQVWYPAAPSIAAARDRPLDRPADDPALAASLADLVQRNCGIKVVGDDIVGIRWMNLRDRSDDRREFAVNSWTISLASEEHDHIALFSLAEDDSVRCLLCGPGYGVTPLVAHYESPVLFWPCVSGMGQYLLDYELYSLDDSYQALNQLAITAPPTQLSGVSIWTDRNGRICISSRQGDYQILQTEHGSFAFVEVEAAEWRQNTASGHPDREDAQ